MDQGAPRHQCKSADEPEDGRNGCAGLLLGVILGACVWALVYYLIRFLRE